jgi:hypothetical protein
MPEARAGDLIGTPATEPAPPAWLSRIFERTPWKLVSGENDPIRIQVVDSQRWAQIKVTFPIHGVSHEIFEQLVCRAYRDLASELSERRARHAVRLWAFIPDIRARSGSGLDRYKVFNAGRFSAFQSWFGGAEGLRMVPAGTAVGWGDSQLALHCLSTIRPGEPVENPRQIPAYRYSKRYGPKPPCFARATRIQIPGESPVLFVGGTASIFGEDSLHRGNMREQLAETFRNLASVARSAFTPVITKPPTPEDWLQVYRYLRVYYLNSADLDTLTGLVAERCPLAEEIEFVQAKLCRPELLVEIEGLARAD